MRFHTLRMTEEEAEAGSCSFESTASFAQHTTTYDQPNSIQHWQLRDLVSCVEDDRGTQTLYTVCGRQTVGFDVQSEQSTVVQELLFSPTSMTVGEGFIAAGGTSSQLDVRSLDGMFSFKGTVGGSVNNSMHIAKDQQGKAVLFVANNDRTIKVYSLPAMERSAVIPTDTPINYAALSPDASQLAAVGDHYQLYFFRAAPAGWVPSHRWRAGRDAGMCCAWSPSGDVVAAAFQDGMVALWDVRSGEIVHSLMTSHAARCVKFSGGPADLLAIAEHQGVAHLVDMRRMSSVQTLRPDDPDGHPHNISGLAFSTAGKQLYIGLEEGGIARYEVNLRARRTFAAGSLA